MPFKAARPVRVDGAIFSVCGNYRLRLDRQIDMFDGPTIGWCPHNPSTAGVKNEDPSSRRMIDFTRRWGGSRMVLVNPWAGRATKPTDLWRMADPVGPDNDEHIKAAARECAETGGFMVAAWGAVSPPLALHATVHARLTHVAALIRSTGCEIRALGITANGSPMHPLYVRADAVPMVWTRPGLQRPVA